MRKKQILIPTIGLLSQLIFAQDFDKTKLDSYFNALEQNDRFMGSVAVSQNGEIIYAKSIGFADAEKKVKATEHTKYRIGSITKSFTAVMMLKAAEEKKVDLNQPISTWFPTIKNAKEITVKHLLLHRSGIHDFTTDKNYLMWNTQPKAENEMIKIMAKGGSDFRPDSKAEYSNSNFVLLSFILEKIYSKPYAELVQEYIIKPLGLTNTYVFGKINTSNNECKSYKFLGSWIPQTETDPSIPLGAGALISTPIDLTKFADGLFSGKLLTTESLESMKTMKDDYGIGLFQMPIFKSMGFGHTGGIDGFSSVFAHFADRKISYALTCNGNNYRNNEISVAVLSAMFGTPYEIPVFSNYTLTSEDLEQYLGLYTSKETSFKITILKDGNTLIAKGKGQPAFPLEATEKDKFKFEQANVKFEFNPTEKTMILFQGGGQLKFTRK